MSKVATAQSIGADRAVPKIKPAAVKIVDADDDTRILKVNLPNGFEFVDINEAPDAWGPVQSETSKSLVWRDEVRMLSYDRAWEAIAYVVYSDHERAVFSKPVRIDHAGRANITETDDHFVRWLFHPALQSTGYCVVRKSDSQIIAGPYKTAAQAVLPRPAQVA